jgi:integrase
VLHETGLRRGDAVRLGPQHVRDGVIRLSTEKTGTPIAIAMTDTLQRAIEAGRRGVLTFIVGAWTSERVRASFAIA